MVAYCEEVDVVLQLRPRLTKELGSKASLLAHA